MFTNDVIITNWTCLKINKFLPIFCYFTQTKLFLKAFLNSSFNFNKNFQSSIHLTTYSLKVYKTQNYRLQLSNLAFAFCNKKNIVQETYFVQNIFKHFRLTKFNNSNAYLLLQYLVIQKLYKI